MDSITQSGLASINSALSLANESANTIATSFTAPEQQPAEEAVAATPEESQATVTEAVVDLALAELQSKAGVKVLQTADEVVGTLIDTKV